MNDSVHIDCGNTFIALKLNEFLLLQRNICMIFKFIPFKNSKLFPKLTTMIFNRILLTITFLLSSFYGFSQGIGIGQWRDHLPYGETTSVAMVDEIVYCATPYNIFSFNKSDNSLRKLSKINGLSDFGISQIEYSQTNDMLFVAYKNANIDLISEGNVTNLPDIKRANLLGNKNINNILFIDQLAYLSCGFGIVVVDVSNQEIRDTWFIGDNGEQINVSDLAVNDTSFIAATQNGLLYADKTDPNLANFANWQPFTNVPHQNCDIGMIENYQGRLLVNCSFQNGNDDTLYVFNGNAWDYLDTANAVNIRNMTVSDGMLSVSAPGRLLVYNENLNLEQNISGSYVTNTQSYVGFRPNEVILDGKDYWLADDRNGLIKVMMEGESATIYQPVGPPTILSFEMAGAGESVWIATGGKTSVWSAVFNSQGMYQFTDEDWNVYNGSTVPQLWFSHDYICVAVDPFDPDHVFAGQFRADTGIVEFQNNAFKNQYSDENSSLDEWDAANSLAITGLDFDSEGSLWAVCSGATEILSVRIPDGSENGEWHAFNLGSAYSAVDAGEIAVDRFNQKWIIKRKTIQSPVHLIVFNENGTMSDLTDDDVKGITGAQGNGNIQANSIVSMAVDQDGELWLGTDNGIEVIYSPENVFTGGNYDAQRIIIPRNDGSGLGDILLENERITEITIDGANRKWIGTDNAGVFLLSEDGMEEIYHFNEDNSPLFSNLINSIAINADGEVFIGTSKGVISFKGESTPARPVFDEVYAYPNPVKPSYTGKIGIKGLVKDADVKITDINGNLVYATRAQGGQAVWNGNKFNGERAQTGVYLVYIASEDGSETMVTKIMFIN